MTRHLRLPRRTAAAALAAAALLAAAPASAAPAAAPVRAAGAVAAPRSDDGDGEHLPEAVEEVPQEAYEELAGSAAGVGREHPGRPAGAPVGPEFVALSRPVRPVHPVPPPQVRPEPVTPPSAVPSPPGPVTALGTEPNERAADLAAHLLPLGTGLALMGLGLGYMGMRLRRGR
ncbi:hypothetical protein [Streptomyces sp. NBC_00091]|uniref:hypothetical protein n=1 Tax=Streptomyces sp. NBC_00091 TaxID=2975648 RepID=UPI002257F0EE|nr:hypothetical protein [Streptomyces sp. NBC_00091]MCX5377273.1 hypothetical protein [Streptomyces sp. NBC_00091]